MNIIEYKLKDNQYYQEEHTKTQIFIHHTAGSSNPYFVIDGWAGTTDKICTPYVIAGASLGNKNYKDGNILQCFSEKAWAYHLGLKSSTFTKYGLPYKSLDKTSIGIELCSWGYLTKTKENTFKNYVGGIVPSEQVVKLSYKEQEFYHEYSDAQLSSLKELLKHLCATYSIPSKFNEGMFSINQACLNGSPGIWSHTSVREDKYDVYPNEKLISMLKTLEEKTV